MDVRFALPRPPLALGLSLLCLALAGCSSTPKAPEVHPGLAVFDKSIGLPPHLPSIVREGDQLTYLVMSPDGEHLYARFDTSCTQPIGSMYYPTKRGMGAFAERLSNDNSLPAPQLQQLRQSPQLQQACAQRPAPDWRALEQADGQDWLMLDRNSVQQENGLLSVWIGRNPLRFSFIPNGAELRGQTRERLIMDCGQQTLMLNSEFTLSARGNVYGGRIESKATQQPLSAATPYQQRAFKAACLPSVELATLPVAKQRQPLPPVLTTPEAAPQVLAAIDALALPPSNQTLRQLSYRYDVQMFNGMDIEDMTQDTLISTDAASGQVLLQTMDPVVKPAAIQLTFLGLFDLAARSVNKDSGEEQADGRPLIDLSFTGDWQAMPSNTEVSYTRTFSKTPSPQNSATSDSNTVTCKIGREQPANRVHRELVGTAKLLSCLKIKAKPMSWTEDYWYLTEYRLFVKANDNSPLGHWKWSVKSVE